MKQVCSYTQHRSKQSVGSQHLVQVGMMGRPWCTPGLPPTETRFRNNAFKAVGCLGTRGKRKVEAAIHVASQSRCRPQKMQWCESCKNKRANSKIRTMYRGGKTANTNPEPSLLKIGCAGETKTDLQAYRIRKQSVLINNETKSSVVAVVGSKNCGTKQ